MPSPFPGMNPFLEQNDTWEDFHLNLISRIQEALSGIVGPNYFVKAEVRLYVHELTDDEKRYFAKADVGVTTESEDAFSAGGAVTLAAPMILKFPQTELQKQRYLEIRDRRNRRLVTVIELLSPANKNPRQNRSAYLEKRHELLAGTTHLVEIDLRRGGSRPEPPVLPACDYYVLVSRYPERPNFGFWPIRLRERLPLIPIPLSSDDADIELDLQEVLHRVYHAADYGKYIYTETPEPPLAPDDAAWAKQFVPEKDSGN